MLEDGQVALAHGTSTVHLLSHRIADTVPVVNQVHAKINMIYSRCMSAQVVMEGLHCG